MTELLADNPILLLFSVIALGHLLGRVSIGGFHLGAAAVLFVGLAFGAVDERLALDETVYLLGLVLFVYSVGLASGHGFVTALRRGGLRANLAVFAVLIAVAAAAVGLGQLLDLAPALTSGLYAGSLTNTPALAAVIELLRDDPAAASQPVVAFSVAYPVGVLGMIAAIAVTRRLLGVPWPVERDTDAEELHAATLAVSREAVIGSSIDDVRALVDAPVTFSRLRHEGEDSVVGQDVRLAAGDLLLVVGTPQAIAEAERVVGERTDERLDMDRSRLDFRRVFISSTEVAGRTVHDLGLEQRFAATLTRIRRGDQDRVADEHAVLELGDRVRVVAPRSRMAEVSRYLGDSYRQLSEIDVTAFALGLVAGLLLGVVPIPLPGGAALRLGLAGGPLLVGLLLSALGRTGRMVWQVPYSANLTLRQIGTVLFLAGIGTRSGVAFWQTVSTGGGATLLAGAALITVSAATAFLVLAVRVLHLPLETASGMLGGLQTQPAVLAFSVEQSGSDLPNLGYATVFPVAMITKIVLAQLLLVLLA